MKRQELTDKIEEHLESLNLKDANVDTLNEGIVQAVRTSADEVCPFEEMLKKKEPWQDQTLLDLNKKLKKCKNPRAVKRLQKEVKECRKRLKNDYFRNLADGINSVAEARQVDKEFALAKKYTAIKSGTRCTISKSKLKSHFEQHFAARDVELPQELKNPEQFPYLADDQFNINQDEPSQEEVKQVLPSFKNGRSWGTDKLKTEETLKL